MDNTNTIFAEKLKKFSQLFETGFEKEKARELRVELNLINRNEAINIWIDVLREHCPVEETAENIYEIHDILTFNGEGNSDDYIHVIKISDNDDTASVFMKFYFVLYCIANKLKSNSYNLSQKN